MPVCGREFAT
ncbi:hypothetical protein YPPY94_3707, partial [Yersinia pestis PY-94]